MSIIKELIERSGDVCELCTSTDELSVFEVVASNSAIQQSIYICKSCKSQIVDKRVIDVNHWHCLNDSIWSIHPAVQVQAYRVLKSISHEPWAQDLLDSLYLEDDIQAWADESITEIEEKIPTKDSNGTILNQGDNVTIIKDLDVKGASFVAKRGTIVKSIHLTDNNEQVEGRVNGVKIVLLSKFLRKA